MTKVKRTLSFDVEVKVEEREGYFAASTNPFAITAYDDTEGKAEERAVQAVTLLLGKYSSTTEELSNYLNRMGVKHTVRTEELPERRHTIVRECRRELRVEARAGV